MVDHADIDHTGLTGIGSGDVATDAIWDAAGDLVVGTGANTAAKLAIGSTGDILRVTGGTADWEAPGSLWAPGSSGAVAFTAASVNPTLGTGGTSAHRYIQIGKLVLVWGNVTFGSSGVAAGTGEYRLARPVAAVASEGGAALGSAVLFDSAPANTFNLAVVYHQSTTTVRIAITGTGLTVGAAAPWTWAANDQINYFYAYEAA